MQISGISGSNPIHQKGNDDKTLDEVVDEITKTIDEMGPRRGATVRDITPKILDDLHTEQKELENLLNSGAVPAEQENLAVMVDGKFCDFINIAKIGGKAESIDALKDLMYGYSSGLAGNSSSNNLQVINKS